MNAKQNAVDKLRAQLFKGLSELALLSLLDQRPHYGLELLQRLWDEAGFELAEGTVYPLLYRLERLGRITSDWRLGEGKARPKKYYEMTASGKKHLKELRLEWRNLRSQMDKIVGSVSK